MTTISLEVTGKGTYRVTARDNGRTLGAPVESTNAAESVDAMIARYAAPHVRGNRYDASCVKMNDAAKSVCTMIPM